MMQHLLVVNPLQSVFLGAADSSLIEEHQRVHVPSPAQTPASLSAAPSLLFKAHMQGSQKQEWALHTHE